MEESNLCEWPQVTRKTREGIILPARLPLGTAGGPRESLPDARGTGRLNGRPKPPEPPALVAASLHSGFIFLPVRAAHAVPSCRAGGARSMTRRLR